MAAVLFLLHSVPLAGGLAQSIDEIFQLNGNAIERPNAVSAGGDGSVDLVETNFAVQRLYNIDQVAKTWGMMGYWRIWWKDHRLAYNETAVGLPVINILPTYKSRIWMPDLYWEGLAYTIGPEDDYQHGQFLRVYPDGSVWMSEQWQIHMTCKVDLKDMPFDTQHCLWQMGLYSWTSDLVRVSWRPGIDAFKGWANKACSSGWAATALSQQNVEQAWSSGNYSYAEATLSMTRRGANGLIDQYFVLSVIFVFISYLGTWVNQGATPARVALGVITILAVLSNFQAIAKSLPPGLDAGDVWLLHFVQVSLYFNVGCFFEQIIVHYAWRCHGWVKDHDAASTSSKAGPSYAKVRTAPQGVVEEEPDDEQFYQQKKEESTAMLQSIAETQAQSIANLQRTIANLQERLGVDTVAPVSSTKSEDLEDPPVRALRSMRSLAAAPAAVSATPLEESSVSGMAPGRLRRHQSMGATMANLVEQTVAPVIQRSPSSARRIASGGLKTAGKFQSGSYSLMRFLARLRHLDAYSRVIIPLGYLPFVFFKLMQVGFGSDYRALIASSGCK